MVLTRGPDEWLATFADPVRAQRAIDRFTHRTTPPLTVTTAATPTTDDLVSEGESSRTRLTPTLKPPAAPRKGTAAG